MVENGLPCIGTNRVQPVKYVSLMDQDRDGARIRSPRKWRGGRIEKTPATILGDVPHKGLELPLPTD